LGTLHRDEVVEMNHLDRPLVARDVQRPDVRQAVAKGLCVKDWSMVVEQLKGVEQREARR
jgi:hypothetical protein